MIDVPVEVKKKRNLDKARREYSKMKDSQLFKRYCDIINYLYAKQEADEDEYINGVVTARDGTRFNIEAWELVLRKYEIMEEEIKSRQNRNWVRFAKIAALKVKIWNNVDKTGIAKLN